VKLGPKEEARDRARTKRYRSAYVPENSTVWMFTVDEVEEVKEHDGRSIVNAPSSIVTQLSVLSLSNAHALAMNATPCSTHHLEPA